MDDSSSVSSWEAQAEDFVRWARTPGHDAYWYYSPAFFDEIVPAAGAQTLDLGCGEGRTSRDLKARGHHVVGIDSSPTLLRYARKADPVSHYELADAAHLPFSDASFDTVVAYNALMTINDLPGSVREAARVLQAGGHFCVSVPHPINAAGAFASEAADAPFVIAGSYLESKEFSSRFARGGLAFTFHAWTHSLSDYFQALEEPGLLIDRLREPLPSAELVRREPAYERSRRVPIFLWLRAIKR